MSAPSAHNRQPWRFAVITQLEQKIHLSKLLSEDFQKDLSNDGLSEKEIESRIYRSRNRITTSPVVIILCMDMTDMDKYDDPDGLRAQAERVMTVQSTACAGMLLLLAARAEGLDSVWTCSPLFAPASVQAALSLPECWEPQAMFFLGYSSVIPKNKIIKQLNEVTKFL